MFQKHGSPFQIIDRVYRKNGKNPGVFEIILYNNFIYLNNARYQYSIVNSNELLKNYLSEQQYKAYLERYYQKYVGNCGLLERVMDLLDRDNKDAIIRLFNDYKLEIVRSDCDIKSYRLQKRFLEKVDVYILAASQDHFFGENGSKKYIWNIVYRHAKDKINIFQRNAIHKILYKISPAYRSNCHINVTLLRMEAKLNEIYSHIDTGT